MYASPHFTTCSFRLNYSESSSGTSYSVFTVAYHSTDRLRKWQGYIVFCGGVYDVWCLNFKTALNWDHCPPETELNQSFHMSVLLNLSAIKYYFATSDAFDLAPSSIEYFPTSIRGSMYLTSCHHTARFCISSPETASSPTSPQLHCPPSPLLFFFRSPLPPPHPSTTLVSSCILRPFSWHVRTTSIYFSALSLIFLPFCCPSKSLIRYSFHTSVSTSSLLPRPTSSIVLSSLPMSQPRTSLLRRPTSSNVLLHCQCLSPVHHCCHVQLLLLCFLHCPCLSPVHHCCHVQLLLLCFLHCPCVSPVHHCCHIVLSSLPMSQPCTSLLPRPTSSIVLSSLPMSQPRTSFLPRPTSSNVLLLCPCLSPVHHCCHVQLLLMCSFTAHVSAPFIIAAASNFF